MGWTVQEVQTVQVVVGYLDEEQSCGFMSLQHKARDADDPDCWNDEGEDEDDDDSDDESKRRVVPSEKIVWDEVVDIDESQRIGGKRRIGKHT